MAAEVGEQKAPAKPAVKVNLNPQVAAMADNTWIKLPTPVEHPISRSASPWMPYVPEAGVALLWGCSHSCFQNDVWIYDLGANAWKEMLKTESSAAADPGVLKIKDGVLMTREERPLSFHQWCKMDYDSDRQVLWHTGGSWQGLYDPVTQLQEKGFKIKEEGDPTKYKGKGLLWKYELKPNKWSLVAPDDPTGCTKHNRGSIRYFPPLRKLIMFPSWVQPNEDPSNFKLYDPDSNKWEPLHIEWKPLEGSPPPCWVWGVSPAVYDSKRQALVLILSAGGTWLLEPLKKTCTQIATDAKTPCSLLDGPIGAYQYDSVNNVMLGIFADYTTYNCGVAMKAKGFATDETHVWALDLEKKEWVQQPRPANGVLPPLGGMFHHYYDPVQNATVIYKGGYNSENTEIWVYRYKRRTESMPDLSQRH
jgi:hypothetical protein